MVWNHFEHLQDGPKGKVQDVLCKMPLATKPKFLTAQTLNAGTTAVAEPPKNKIGVDNN